MVKLIVALLKYIIICALWMELEIKLCGKAQPRIVDDIIGLILFYYILKSE